MYDAGVSICLLLILSTVRLYPVAKRKKALICCDEWKKPIITALLLALECFCFGYCKYC